MTCVCVSLLLFVLTLQPTLKNRNVYNVVISDNHSSISQNLKVVRLMGETFNPFLLLKIQIEVDCHHGNTRIKLSSFTPLK